MATSALACQSLPHYSDFDATSESGLSDLSYVHPYRLKRTITRNKPVKTGPSEVKLGARAMRRYENEVYLNTLAVITETDGDNFNDWPDSADYCSAFTKLLEDENIRAAWDMFIQLSEKEQEKLLNTLSMKNKNDVADSDDYDFIEDDVMTNPFELSPSSLSKRHVKHRCRRSKREGRNRNKFHVNSLESNVVSLYESIGSEVASDNMANTENISDLEIEQRIPTRLLSSISLDSTHHVNNLKHNRKRTKRHLTAVDICLLKRAEIELRQCFFSEDDPNNSTRRWTPSLSLITRSPPPSIDCTTTNSYSHSSLLCLDSFQRLLIHSVASYLGLNSYSTWSNSLGERQLWVEQILGKRIQPPAKHFVTLIEQKLTQCSSLLP
uniref:R3H-associated N-terminal domain-containing protein n=1 Tax=Schistosoma japonicum TaxID=6182 RepID=C1L5P6_SCHJA|nr:hypothetical protein [Schistosoma japonicum]